MKKFFYTAYDTAGARHQGEVSALSPDSVRLRLKDQGLIPIKISPVPEKTLPAGILERFFQPGKPGLAHLEFFTFQMAMLLKNGVKIDKAIELVRKSIRQPLLIRSVNDIYETVRSGTALAVALEKHPRIFDPLYVSIIRIGETTGSLSDAFSALARNLKFRREIRSKTLQSLAYPAVIFTVCLLAVIFIFNFIIPRFESLFARMDEMPVYTAMLLAVSHFFNKYQWLIYTGIPALALLTARFSNHPLFTRAVDALVLKLPVTRKLVYTLENLRFSSSMALLLKSGVLMVDALAHSVRAVGNSIIRRSLLTVKENVKHGRQLSQAMTKTGFFPETYGGILEVGEQSGAMAEVFSDLEERMRTEYEGKLQGLITFIEPLMIIIMGLIVGTIVVVMLLSTVSLQQIRF